MNCKDYSGMNLRRTAFTNQHCPVCAGKIMRLLLGRALLVDDNGGELLQTLVVDRCNCGQPSAQSTLVNWPCPNLEDLFDRWNKGDLSLADFDKELIEVLRSAGSEWRAQAS